MQHFDVIVIGSGPGGYICAIRAAQLGLTTAIVEREHLGGICLNWGCIPTKALLKSAELYHNFSRAGEFGFKHNGISMDFGKVISRSRDVAGKLSGGVGFLMKKNNITVLKGEGCFKNPTTLTVKNKKAAEDITFKHAVIATGARARQIPGVLEADGKHIWTYKEAMIAKACPKSLLVIGAGAIGVEFASFYQTLGCKVTIVEAQPRVLPIEDAEVSAIAEKSFIQQGIDIKTSTKTLAMNSSSKGVTATFEDAAGKQEEKTFEKVLLAIGVQGNTEGLGLEALGIKTERGQVQTDPFYRTTVPNIHAIGDVAGAPWLAHVASHEGIICAEHMAGQHPHPMDYENIPGCTYCMPQVASVGLTEDAAKERGYTIKVGRFTYQANGKALAIGEPEGLVKTIFDTKTGALLGAHIIGAEATEMISTFVVAKQLESTEEDLIHACLPHPTLSEMIAESVLSAEGRALNG